MNWDVDALLKAALGNEDPEPTPELAKIASGGENVGAMLRTAAGELEKIASHSFLKSWEAASAVTPRAVQAGNPPITEIKHKPQVPESHGLKSMAGAKLAADTAAPAAPATDDAREVLRRTLIEKIRQGRAAQPQGAQA